MPNHIHGLINIVDGYRCETVETQHAVSLPIMESSRNKFQRAIPKSLSVIIRGYKSAVTNLCHHHNFIDIVWQRNYYERIIRTKDELNRIRQYIKNNATNWKNDRNNIYKIL